MFTRDEFDVLIEAMDAWERGDSGGEIMANLLYSMARRGADAEGRAEIDRLRAKEKIERAAAQRIRKDRAILLKAKLITLRNAATTDQLEIMGTEAEPCIHVT